MAEEDFESILLNYRKYTTKLEKAIDVELCKIFKNHTIPKKDGTIEMKIFLQMINATKLKEIDVNMLMNQFCKQNSIVFIKSGIVNKLKLTNVFYGIALTTNKQEVDEEES